VCGSCGFGGLSCFTKTCELSISTWIGVNACWPVCRLKSTGSSTASWGPGGRYCLDFDFSRLLALL
jgi:hypothetical protein